MTTLLIIVGAWIALNLLHTAWVETRRSLWEKRVRRGPDGLLPGASAYSVGTGDTALLFIHGFADTPFIWRRMTSQLASGGRFTCRAMRLPGCAEPATRGRRASLPQWRSQVAEEIARLRQTHQRVWLVGHSLGGALALDAALRTPDTVDGVAVFAPLIQVSNKRSPLLPPPVWFRLARFALLLSPTFESCFSAEGAAVDDPEFRYARDRFIPFAVYCGLFTLIRANRQKARSLACPLFAATAERDAVVDTRAALRWVEACGAPKEIHALSDIGHVIPLETGWADLTEKLEAFIVRHTPPA